MSRPPVKRGPKHGRLRCIIPAPPLEAEQLRAWRRQVAFALVGDLEARLPPSATKFAMRAALVPAGRDLWSIAHEVIEVLVLAAIVSAREHIVDVQLTRDRVVPDGQIAIDIKSTTPPERRQSAAARLRSSERLLAARFRVTAGSTAPRSRA